MATVGYIGLGTMGAPMAGHLVRAGHRVVVHNRTAARAREWAAVHGGEVNDSPAGVAAVCDVVLVCVGDDPDVRDVVEGPGGILESARPGTVVADHTTTSARLAREMAVACSARGVHFIDAPVSGGQSGAEAGTLSVMGGAEDDDAWTVFEGIARAYARSVVRIGGVGAGQTAKMVNQICIAGVIESLAEGLAFARRAGLDTDALLEAIGGGAARSWQMENRAASMLEGRFDFGFAVEWMIKDLGHCLDEAERIGAELPSTESILGWYREVLAAGGARLDTSSLITRLP